jgi:hypothetical protein
MMGLVIYNKTSQGSIQQTLYNCKYNGSNPLCSSKKVALAEWLGRQKKQILSGIQVDARSTDYNIGTELDKDGYSQITNYVLLNKQHSQSKVNWNRACTGRMIGR